MPKKILAKKQQPPVYVITLSYVDPKTGKPYCSLSAGTDDLSKLKSSRNFNILFKEFKERIRLTQGSSNSIEERRKAWTKADELAAKERREKLDKLMKEKGISNDRSQGSKETAKV